VTRPDDPPDPPGSPRDTVARGEGSLPFPESLCHRCAAPPRYVRTERSVFVMCPLVPEKYPRQPVVTCPLFRQRDPTRNA
jgi:hypothetical protein